jgi:nicotinamide mononucleotide transporter
MTTVVHRIPARCPPSIRLPKTTLRHTAVSLAAQWLLNLKQIENWYFWIAADIVYIPLYFVKALDLTGVVYVLFLTMCLLGLRAWSRGLAADAPVHAAPAVAA